MTKEEQDKDEPKYGFGVYCPIWFHRTVQEAAKRFNGTYWTALNEWRVKAEAYDAMMRIQHSAQVEQEAYEQMQEDEEDNTVSTFTGRISK